MNPKRLVIVGGVAGGASAAARARRLSEDAEIIIFERGPHVSFANCGLPYHIGGEIEDKDELLLQTPASLKARFNLDVRVLSEVIAINRQSHLVRVREVQTGREYDQPYDALVLSTGAAPLKPGIPGMNREGHFTVRNVPDAEAIKSWIAAKQAKRAVVAGGGYIGLEMAEQLRRLKLDVALVEMQSQVMLPLDPEMAAWLHKELRSNGVDLHLNDGVSSFESPQPAEQAQASVVVLKSGKRLPADLVILGLGVKPDIALAREAGLEIGALGGIRVNEQLQTSDPSIMAVGDAVEVKDAITGAWSLIPLAGPANRQGRAAANVLFGRSAQYLSTLGTGIVRLFKLSAGCTGANEKTLRKTGIPFQAIHLHPGSHAGYFPGAEPIAMKILFSPDSGRLLGAQAVGTDGVDKRLDVFATALKAGMTVHDLADLELSYAPPFGSAKDPVNLAGMAAQNVLAGDVKLIQWNEIPALDATKTVILDVRNDGECKAGRIPGSTHIPLPQLRGRINELPKDKEIIVHCQSGLRSYFACRFLSQKGYSCRNLTGSYRTWKTAQG